LIVNKAALKNNPQIMPFIQKIEELVGNEEVAFQ
jgi:ATP phosphoribosyltransferase